MFCFFWHFPVLPVSIFAAAKKNHIQAQEWRHIQTLTTSVSEILEDSDGTAKSFVSLFPDGQIQDNLIEWYYDSSWQLCSDSQASYKMELTLNETANSRQGTLTFYHATNDIQIYTIDLVFPIIENSDKEGQLMKDHNSFLLPREFPSLFLIFSVLCLAVLSLLTLEIPVQN